MPNLPDETPEPLFDQGTSNKDSQFQTNQAMLVLGKLRFSRRTVLIGLVGIGTLIGAGTVAVVAVRSTRPPLGQLLYTYRHHEGPVYSVAWSPDGTRIVSGGGGESDTGLGAGEAYVWYAADGRMVLGGDLRTFYPVYSVAWSPNSKYIALAEAGYVQTLRPSRGTVNVFDVSSTFRMIDVALGDDFVPKFSAAWSPDSTGIAYEFRISGDPYGDIEVSRIPTPSDDTTDLYGYDGVLPISSIAWSPDGRFIAGASLDGWVGVWSTCHPGIHGGDRLLYHSHKGPVNSVAWSPDGGRITSASDDKTVQVWSASDRSDMFTFTYRGHSDTVWCVAWSPDGKRIASGSSDKTVQVWNASDGSNVFTYRGHSDIVRGVAWSPDGTRIASAGEDKTVQVWSAG